MNREERIAVASRIAWDFRGRMVDCNIDGIQYRVAALKARKTPKAVELMLSLAYRGNDGSPQVGLRLVELYDARLNMDDYIWVVRDSTGMTIALEFVFLDDPAFAEYRDDPDLVAHATVKLVEYAKDSGGELIPGEELPLRPAWRRKASPVDRVRYLGTVIRRWTGSEYVDLGVALTDPQGALYVVSVIGNKDWEEDTLSALEGAVGSHANAEALLRYLYRRNSTVTSYSEVTPVVATSPAEAAGTLVRTLAG